MFANSLKHSETKARPSLTLLTVVIDNFARRATCSSTWRQTDSSQGSLFNNSRGLLRPTLKSPNTTRSHHPFSLRRKPIKQWLITMTNDLFGSVMVPPCSRTQFCQASAQGPPHSIYTCGHSDSNPCICARFYRQTYETDLSTLTSQFNMQSQPLDIKS